MYPLKTKAPYNPNNLASTGNIFTTVYLGNYLPGDFNELAGSHPGVDMIPQVKHDNIFACLPGIILKAGFSDMDGNYVVIKHQNAPDPSDFSKTTTLYSCHLHLSELDVKVGDNVDEGSVIGKSGNTGNSTGEHLHFQIDTEDAPFHPYWPFSSLEAKNAGMGFFEAVNNKLGIDNARKYTINPLVYLDSVAAHKGETKPQVNFSAPPFANKSVYFKDVQDNVEEIDFLAQRGVTKGYGDGTYRPNSNISRAELLAMTFNFGKINLGGNGATFSDVSSTDWYYPYIQTASAKGFISGYPDGTFKPDNPVTRAEATAIVLNTIVGKQNIQPSNDSSYQDVAVTDWYCRYADYVSENGLMDSIGRFYPNDNMKRSDFAVLLYNLKDRI